MTAPDVEPQSSSPQLSQESFLATHHRQAPPLLTQSSQPATQIDQRLTLTSSYWGFRLQGVQRPGHGITNPSPEPVSGLLAALKECTTTAAVLELLWPNGLFKDVETEDAL